MIVIIDYGMGNLHSVENALIKIGAPCKISKDIEEIEKADGLILPGVGAFPDCMANLKKCGLIESIVAQANAGKPLLGICLGMQVLFEYGYEVRKTEGLGLLKGDVQQMVDPSVKIPHIGWNRLEKNHEDVVLGALTKDPFVYYVHSFYVCNYNDIDMKGYSQYGTLKIPGYFHRENILGMQYHPEKSGEDGLKILQVFKEMCV